MFFSCVSTDMEEENFSTIYFEPFPEDSTDALTPFSMDNTIYQLGDRYVFQFLFKDSIGTPLNIYENSDSETWELNLESNNKQSKISKVELSVRPRGKQDSSYRQTNIVYRFLDENNHQVLLSGTGLVENEKNIWMHPPRARLFKILQLSPFPFIKKPYEVGNNFYWQFTVGEYYGDPRWRTWSGLVKIRNDYTITDNTTLDTPLGPLEVLKIEGTGTSRLGSSRLVAYFNRQHGFVELRYTNIDKSIIEMKLISHEK